MVINAQSQAGHCTLQLQGRFDANWADHVAKALEAAIRAAHHALDLDFAEVHYISSAGIRVLLKYYRQLKGVNGALRVLHPDDAVLSVLRMSGLAAMLLGADAPPAAALAAPAPAADPAPRCYQRAGVEFEAHALCEGGALEGQVLGNPAAFGSGQLSAGQSQLLRCTADIFAVGLGAFGPRPEDTESRFGETLAAAGVAVTQPTDGSSVPDYQVTEGELVPELQMLYGLVARGQFSRLLRFEAIQSDRGVVSLGALVDAILEDVQTPSAAIVILAESASVVGATLKRSPALAAGKPPLAFPDVRDWLSFTTERTDERNVVLVAGVAVQSPPPDAASCLRPIGPGTQAHGHFHAAVFPYRPLPKGKLELRDAVASVLGTECAQSVMHLLADEREFEGVGQTDLMRGACWAGPLRFVNGAPKPSL